MTSKFLLVLSALLISVTAQAQEYGLLVGVHQTTASVDDVAGAKIDGKFGFKAGLAMAFELGPMMKFRTGAIYNQRHFDLKYTVLVTDHKDEIAFDYLDVPALFQYNVNEMFGVYGGLIVGINVNDKINYKPDQSPKPDAGVNGLIPLVQVGGNFLFQDMIGFDVYYERGLGKIANNLKDYGTFGANFLYYF